MGIREALIGIPMATFDKTITNFTKDCRKDIPRARSKAVYMNLK